MESLIELLMQSPSSGVVAVAVFLVFCCFGWILNIVRFAVRTAIGLAMAVAILHVTSIGIEATQDPNSRLAMRQAVEKAALIINSGVLQSGSIVEEFSRFAGRAPEATQFIASQGGRSVDQTEVPTAVSR